jgi:hypothetical protein
MRREPPATIRLPKLQHEPRGKPRRVGVELEMIGLELNDIAEIVAEHLGLAITTDGRYRRVLTGDDAGDWIVELDFDLLQAPRPGGTRRGGPARRVARIRRDLLKTLAELIVPLELVSPPLPMRSARRSGGAHRAAARRGRERAPRTA